MADQFTFSVVSVSHHLVALVEAKFMTKGTRAAIIPGKNAKWNRKFLEFPNLPKKDQNFLNKLLFFLYLSTSQL